MSGFVRLDDVSIRFVIRHNRSRSLQDAVINFLHHQVGTTEEFWALRNVSLEVRPGETLGLIGENGSGKSTILKLITKILRPTDGRVTVQGKVSALIELGAGFHPDLTGRENIYLNGSILGMGRRQMDRLFDEIVDFSELSRFIDTPVKHYSSGMYARLGFSVAISVDPDVLIIDEVLSVGDEAFKLKCMDRIHEFQRRNKTIIIVSHDLVAVEKICDRAVWLHQGRVKAEGAGIATVRYYVDTLQRSASWVDHDGPLGSADRTEGAAAPAEVLGVELLSDDGETGREYRANEPVIVRIRYRVGEPASDHLVRVDLRRRDGVLIHRASRRFGPDATVEEGGVLCAQVAYPDLRLCPGDYYFASSVQSAAETSDGDADQPEQIREFSIVDEAEAPGIVTLPHHWSMAPEPRITAPKRPPRPVMPLVEA